MRTETVEQTYYTARELQERHPDAFETARYQSADMDWEAGFMVEEALDDFERVLESIGITAEQRAYQTIGGHTRYEIVTDHSISAYPDRDEYVRFSGTVTDPDRFLRALAGKAPEDYVTAEYWRGAPTAPRDVTDRRRAFARGLLAGDIRVRFHAGRYGYQAGADIEWVGEYGDVDSQTRREDAIEAADEAAEALYRWLGERVIEYVHDDYEYRASAEAFIDAAEANGWEYDESGHLV